MHGELGIYSPRLDLAVGPFAVADHSFGADYTYMANKHVDFVRLLYEASIENVDRYAPGIPRINFDEVLYRNENSRCFMAVEIENRVSRKHLMGGAINASSLGRVGVAVGWTDDAVRVFARLLAYLSYLSRVGKNSFAPYNLLVVSKDEFSEAIRREATNAVGFTSI